MNMSISIAHEHSHAGDPHQYEHEHTGEHGPHGHLPPAARVWNRTITRTTLQAEEENSDGVPYHSKEAATPTTLSIADFQAKFRDRGL
jgi:hypothetical protein